MPDPVRRVRRRRLRILISSGPTREPIDAVRFISNYSTGVMGQCVAREAWRRGHRVTFVSGPTQVQPPAQISAVRVESARQMSLALRRAMPRADVLIMAAAVCDFRPVTVALTKLARRGRLSLRLEATPDLVARLPRRRGQLVVGFALEAARVRERTAKKLRDKRLDLIVGQELDGTGAPFGRRKVDAVLLWPSGRLRTLGPVSKPRLARVLLDEIEQLWYGQLGPQALRKG